MRTIAILALFLFIWSPVCALEQPLPGATPSVSTPVPVASPTVTQTSTPSPAGTPAPQPEWPLTSIPLPTMPASVPIVNDRTRVLTLEECICMALDLHPDIKAALALRTVANAQITIARSNFFPQVSASSSYNYNGSNQSNVVFTGNGIAQTGGRRTSQYVTSFNFSQNILDFGRTQYRVLGAQEGLTSATYDVLAQADQIIFLVQQAYFRAVTADKALQVNREAVQQQQLHLNQARGFYNIGTRPRIEVTKAEVDLANAQLSLLQAENAVAQTRVTLANTIGITGAVTSPLEHDVRLAEIDMDFNQAIEYARTNRPELLSSAAAERGSIADVNAARSDYYPFITGSGSYRWQNEDPNFRFNNWGIGVQVNYDIFDGGARRGRVQAAGGNLEVQRQRNRREWQNIYLEVQQAFITLREAESRLVVLEKAMENARENFRLAQGRYEAGIGTNLEFTDAQVALQRAQLDYNTSLMDFQIARAKVEQATGLTVVSRNLAEQLLKEK